MATQQNSEGVTRRKFMQAAAAAGASALALTGSGQASAANGPDRTHEHGDPLHEFGYGDVFFAPCLQRAQLEQTHAILMGLDEDGLLRPFRMAAGLPAPGRDLGGWHSSLNTFGPESFGHWMSALSRYYSATGDGATRAKVERWLELFSATVDSAGSIFKQFRKASTCIYNKLFCGLEDAYHFAGQAPALDALERMTAAALPYLPGRALDQFDPNNICESYIIPEYQFLAWQWGADEGHLQMARQYLHDSFFDPLSRGENVLPGYHAYSHVNALCSAAKAYLVLGDERYLKAAVNGMAFVEQQSWATGGWGPSESFLPRPAVDYTDPNTGEKIEDFAIGSLADSLLHEHDHFETGCGAHAHFKLTRYLLRITKDPHYGDSMERVMYNTVLGALPLNKFGKAFYQSNYHSHAHKDYFDGYGHIFEDEWPCCSGTLPQVAADYRISTYFSDEDGVFVNLYIPSTLRWEQSDAQVSLTQSGTYPLDDHVTFEISASRPASFSLRLRIPAWAQEPSIRVNGTKLSQFVRSGTFSTIRRTWKSGDRIELQLPSRLELKAVDEKHPDLAALVCGPLVLFAVSDDTPRVSRAQLLAARQQGAGSAEWRADTVNGSLRLAPFWAIKDETYFTYLLV
jgi:DUF1680 family protein